MFRLGEPGIARQRFGGMAHGAHVVLVQAPLRHRREHPVREHLVRPVFAFGEILAFARVLQQRHPRQRHVGRSETTG